jgi:predicted nucleic acid-binding protein
MRVVLDTGILIAALITSGTPPDSIYRAWRKKRFELITSEWQLEEFRRVWRYPKLRTYLKSGDAGRLVNGYGAKRQCFLNYRRSTSHPIRTTTRCSPWHSRHMRIFS